MAPAFSHLFTERRKQVFEGVESRRGYRRRGREERGSKAGRENDGGWVIEYIEAPGARKHIDEMDSITR